MEYHEQGNKHFKAKEYDQAIEQYNLALKSIQDLAAVFLRFAQTQDPTTAKDAKGLYGAACVIVSLSTFKGAIPKAIKEALQFQKSQAADPARQPNDAQATLKAAFASQGRTVDPDEEWAAEVLATTPCMYIPSASEVAAANTADFGEVVKQFGELYAQGNSCSSAEEALEFYRKALDAVREKVGKLFSNKAACYLEKGDGIAAVECASVSAIMLPAFPKAYYRRAAAQEQLGLLAESLSTATWIYKDNPSNQDLKDLVDSVSAKLAQL